MGDVWVREDAGLPMGNFFGRAGRGPKDWIWRQRGAAGVATGAGRTSIDAAAIDCDAGRYGAGVGGATEIAGTHGAVALRFAEFVSGERGRGPPFVGDGVFAARVFWARRARRGGRAAGAAFGRCGQTADFEHVQ